MGVRSTLRTEWELAMGEDELVRGQVHNEARGILDASFSNLLA